MQRLDRTNMPPEPQVRRVVGLDHVDNGLHESRKVAIILSTTGGCSGGQGYQTVAGGAGRSTTRTRVPRGSSGTGEQRDLAIREPLALRQVRRRLYPSSVESERATEITDDKPAGPRRNSNADWILLFCRGIRACEERKDQHECERAPQSGASKARANWSIHVVLSVLGSSARNNCPALFCSQIPGVGPKDLLPCLRASSNACAAEFEPTPRRSNPLRTGRSELRRTVTAFVRSSWHRRRRRNALHQKVARTTN